jgi:hypothetical protein
MELKKEKEEHRKCRNELAEAVRRYEECEKALEAARAQY